MPKERGRGSSSPLITQRTNRLPLDAPETEAGIPHPADLYETAGRGLPLCGPVCRLTGVRPRLATAAEPGLELLLGPVAARDDEEAARADEGQDAAAVGLAHATALVVARLAEADGVEGALVEDDVPATALGAREDGVVVGGGQEVPGCEL